MKRIARPELLHASLIATPMLVLIAMLVGLVPGVADATTAQGAISGRWLLNEELSDDPHEAITAAAEAAGAQLPPPRTRGGNGRERGRPHGPRRGPFHGDGDLTVAVEADVVALAYENGPDHVLRLGRAAAPRDAEEDRRRGRRHGERRGPRMTAVAAWQGGALVVEIETPRGGTVHERWQVDSDGRLVRTVELPVPFADEPVVVQRVYDPA